MLDETFIRSLGFIIVGAAAFSLLARFIKTPPIVAYLVTGLMLGPAIGVVEISEALSLISEIGIVLLLFLAGLELQLHKIRDVGKVAFVAGLGQVVLTALGGFLLSWALGFTPLEALFLATALTFSSTVVVVKLLEEKHELDSLYGRIAIGIFLVQDMVVIVLLTVLGGLDSDQKMTLERMAIQLAKAFGGMGLLLAVALIASKHVLPRPFRWAARSPETLFIWSLCWCFFVVMGAHWMHLSPEIGAFLAGLSLAQLPYNQELRRRVHPLMNFFIAVFFVTLGIKMDLTAAAQHWGAATVLSLFVLIGNVVIFMWIMSRLNYSEEVCFLSGVTVAQISEFSFVFGALAISAGLIEAPILSLIGIIGIVTIGISAFMINYNHQIYAWTKRQGWLRPFKAKQSPEEDQKPPERKGHVVVVGMNSLGRQLANKLHSIGEDVLAIDIDPKKLEALPCDTKLGNVENYGVLEEAGLDRAKLLVSALHIEDTNNYLSYQCRSAGTPCAINVVDLSVVNNLLAMDAAYLMIPKVDGIKLQTRELQRMGILNT